MKGEIGDAVALMLALPEALPLGLALAPGERLALALPVADAVKPGLALALALGVAEAAAPGPVTPEMSAEMEPSGLTLTL